MAGDSGISRSFAICWGAAARMAGGEAEYLQKKIRSLLAAPGFPDDFSLVCLSFDENSG